MRCQYTLEPDDRTRRNIDNNNGSFSDQRLPRALTHPTIVSRSCRLPKGGAVSYDVFIVRFAAQYRILNRSMVGMTVCVRRMQVAMFTMWSGTFGVRSVSNICMLLNNTVEVRVHRVEIHAWFPRRTHGFTVRRAHHA